MTEEPDSKSADEREPSRVADPGPARSRQLPRLCLTTAILAAWLVVLSFAVIELLRHRGPTAEIRRLDQRIDDLTQCLWKLEAEAGTNAPTDRNADGIAGTGPNRPECPPLAVAPGPR